MRLLNVLLVLSVLLFAQCEVLITLFLRLSEGFTQAFHFFLEVFHREGQLELRLRQALGQVADHSLALLHLAHIRLSQSLDFILMRLIELINLVLRLFFANHRLPSIILERFKNSLMVKLHLFFLLLFLFQLESHEFILLLGHRSVLHGLAFQGFILLFQLFDDLLQFLDALAICLLFLLLRLVFLPQLRVKSFLKSLIVIAELIFSLTELLQFTLHHLLAFVPFLALNSGILLFIFELVFEFEDLFGQFFDFGGHVSDFLLVLSFRFTIGICSLNFLLFELLDQLAFFLVLALRLEGQVLDLL